MRNTPPRRQSWRTCGSVALVLLVAVGLAPAATGFGCYANYEEVGGLANWPAHVRLMRDSGMNTFALFCRDEVSLQEQIDAAVEDCMLEQSVPIFVISNVSPVVWKRLMPNWQEVVAQDTDPPPGCGPGELAGFRAVVRAAKARARHPEGWPEIVAYNYDEPGHGEAEWDGQKHVGAIAKAHQDDGMRCGTSVCHPHIKDLVPYLDVLCVNLIIGGDLLGCKKAIQDCGKTFWIYEIHTRRFTPEALRLHVGLYTWQIQPESRLTWSWKDLLGEQADMAHPQTNARLQAYAQGRADFEALTEMEWRLKRLRDCFDWEGFPMEQFTGPEPREPNKWVPVPAWFELVPK